MENTSGTGKGAVVPPEITSQWNWGAFGLSWIWGVANKTYIAFLVFVPLVNLYIPFYLGKRGNELAWQNKQWQSVDQFLSVQKKWKWFTIINWIATAILVAVLWSAKLFPWQD